MKKYGVVALVVLLGFAAVAASYAKDKDKETVGRMLTGKVLDRISLSAETGEIVAVFGPSGSGKTVLLRLIAGVEQPDAGSIFLGGRDVSLTDVHGHVVRDILV